MTTPIVGVVFLYSTMLTKEYALKGPCLYTHWPSASEQVQSRSLVAIAPQHVLKASARFYRPSVNMVFKEETIQDTLLIRVEEEHSALGMQRNNHEDPGSGGYFDELLEVRGYTLKVRRPDNIGRRRSRSWSSICTRHLRWRG